MHFYSFISIIILVIILEPPLSRVDNTIHYYILTNYDFLSFGLMLKTSSRVSGKVSDQSRPVTGDER